MSLGFHTVRRRRRLRRPVLAAVVGLASAGLMALSVSPTVSAFVATIVNSTNTAGSGVLIMEEANSTGLIKCTSNSGSISTNTATCATINKFGGNLAMVPGTPVNTDITIKNTGTIAASTFTLTPGATCTQSVNGAINGTATDLCAKMNIVIKSGVTTVYTGTLADLAGKPAFNLADPVAPGASVPFTFTVTLAASAGNTYQGLQASLPMTWVFTA